MALSNYEFSESDQTFGVCPGVCCFDVPLFLSGLGPWANLSGSHNTTSQQAFLISPTEWSACIVSHSPIHQSLDSPFFFSFSRAKWPISIGILQDIDCPNAKQCFLGGSHPQSSSLAWCWVLKCTLCRAGNFGAGKQRFTGESRESDTPPPSRKTAFGGHSGLGPEMLKYAF